MDFLLFFWDLALERMIIFILYGIDNTLRGIVRRWVITHFCPWAKITVNLTLPQDLENWTIVIWYIVLVCKSVIYFLCQIKVGGSGFFGVFSKWMVIMHGGVLSISTWYLISWLSPLLLTCFAISVKEGMNPSPLPSAMGKIVGQTRLFSFETATSLGKRNLWIKTSCTLLKSWTYCILQRYSYHLVYMVELVYDWILFIRAWCFVIHKIDYSILNFVHNKY